MFCAKSVFEINAPRTLNEPIEKNNPESASLRQGVEALKSSHVNSKCCVYCKKTGTSLIQCTKCHSDLYCSKACQKKDIINRRVLCRAIDSLETHERDKLFKSLSVSDHNLITDKQ